MKLSIWESDSWINPNSSLGCTLKLTVGKLRMQLQHCAIKSRAGFRRAWLRSVAASLMVLVMMPRDFAQDAKPSPIHPIEPVAVEAFCAGVSGSVCRLGTTYRRGTGRRRVRRFSNNLGGRAVGRAPAD